MLLNTLQSTEQRPTTEHPMLSGPKYQKPRCGLNEEAQDMDVKIEDLDLNSALPFEAE